MSDLSARVTPAYEAAAPLVTAALRTFVGTVLTMVFAALAASGLSYAIGASRGAPTHGLVSALLTLVLFGFVGGLLAVKRAVVRAALAGVRQGSLGRKMTSAIFSRMRELNALDGRLERGLARVPLAQAEASLKRAAQAMFEERARRGGVRGWVLNAVHSRLIRRIEAMTLVSLREESARTGSIDLELASQALGAQIDEGIVQVFEASLTKMTLSFLAGALVVSAVASFGLAHLPR